eukprot:scaffold57085_cov46-Attheya_sp.AAC.3
MGDHTIDGAASLTGTPLPPKPEEPGSSQSLVFTVPRETYLVQTSQMRVSRSTRAASLLFQ